MTRKCVVAEQGAHREETIRYFRSKWKIGWLQRPWLRLRRKTIEAKWKWNERLRYGHTLREFHAGGKIYYR